jgi:hypothetical protein
LEKPAVVLCSTEAERAALRPESGALEVSSLPLSSEKAAMIKLNSGRLRRCLYLNAAEGRDFL